MKITQFVALAFLFCCPFMMSAQSILGSWSWEATTPEGKTVKNLLTFEKDGVYKLDIGWDSKTEIEGTYTYENGQVTISDTTEGPCKGAKGVYAMKVEKTQVTATLISDDCAARRGDDPDRPLVMKRVL